MPTPDTPRDGGWKQTEMTLIQKDVSAPVVHGGLEFGPYVFQLPRSARQKCRTFFRRRPPTSSRSTATVKNHQ